MPSAPLTLSPPKRKRLTDLYREFAADYLPTVPAQTYLAALTDSRERARANYLALIARAERGEEITEAVLQTLLPHADSTANRWRGVWIHPAPAIPGDLRTWHEAAGWSQGDEWPRVAAAIFDFVRRALADPAQLATVCHDFTALPQTAGFQSGMLTPILNALAPEAFLLLTNRSRNALNYFAESHFTQSLGDYPVANQTLFALLHELARGRKAADRDLLGLADRFSLFAHWLATVKRFSFRTNRYWALTLDADPWIWREWQEGNMIGIGWDALGDLSGVSKGEFAARRDSLIAQHPTGSKRSAEAVWRFARQLQEGDEVVIYQGDKVLGSGVVTGPYYYVAEVPLGHRHPVEWRDLSLRTHQQKLGNAALIAVDLATFTALTEAPLAQDTPLPTAAAAQSAPPEFALLFAPLLETLQSLGGQARASEVIEAVSDRLASEAGGSDPSPTRVNRLRRQLYRARHYLVRAGLLRAKQHGVWQLTEQGQATALDDGDATRLFEEIEYQQQWQQSLAGESSTLRRLAEGAVTYTTEPAPQAKSVEVAPIAPLESGDNGVPITASIIGSPTATDEVAPYSLASCAAATLIEETMLARWVQSIERKGQAIFYGPPGVGKTFLAEQLARHLAGGSDPTATAGFIEVVQFHPAYAYEDFVQGIRPQPGPDGTLHYPVVAGRFLAFCERAAGVAGRAVLIIDEINRADLARVFGELMYLLEYRERSVRLAADGRSFAIPANVRLLGTMNTADRSIALVDHALRRRFAFIALQPDYALLRRYHQQYTADLDPAVDIEGLIALLQRVNRQISDAHYAIGHSFFLRTDLVTTLPDIWQLEIEPYLEEIFFDQPETVDALRWARVRNELEF